MSFHQPDATVPSGPLSIGMHTMFAPLATKVATKEALQGSRDGTRDGVARVAKTVGPGPAVEGSVAQDVLFGFTDIRVFPPTPGAGTQSEAVFGRPALQRKCACGAYASGGECEGCRREKHGDAQRSASGGARGGVERAPPIVHDVLRSSGEPLGRAARALFESRFAHDFSRVRVHRDGQATRSAQAIDALAYTVGNHIVFAEGQYAPDTIAGSRILAHELTHVVQQGGQTPSPGEPLLIDPSAVEEHEAIANAALSDRLGLLTAGSVSHALQRACMTGAKCPANAGQGAKTKATLDDPQVKARRERRAALCNTRPRDPACTSDGHSARAVQLEALLAGYDADRKTLIFGIFVDKDIPDEWGAYRRRCNLFVPSIAGEQNCAFVPAQLEAEAARFLTSQDPMIGGMKREEWRWLTIRKLMHETGHARFGGLMPDAPRPGACKVDDIWAELQEIAADMDESRALDDMLQRSSLSPAERRAEFEKRLNERWIRRAVDNWTRIKCVCECKDADAYVRKTSDTMMVDWDRSLQIRYHLAIRAADPSWPVDPKPFGAGDFPAPPKSTRPV
ncbi:DUF4157 domain-containing protein [Paraburkholderia sp. SIMBA_049]